MKNKKIFALWNYVLFISLFISSIITGIIYVVLTGFYSTNMFVPLLCLSFSIIFICIANLRFPAFTFSEELDKAEFNAIPWGDYSKNGIDRWNWEVYMNDIKSIEIVRLSIEDKKNIRAVDLFLINI